MELLQVASRLYLVLCSVGCALQIWSFAIEYFAYRTTSDIAPIIPTAHRLPRLSLCFSLSSLIHLDKENNSRGIYLFDNATAHDSIMSMTTDQLFAATPDAGDLLDTCSYTTHIIEDRRTQLNREKCLEYFSVLKYQMLGYMCYRVSVADSNGGRAKTIDFHRIGNSLYDQLNKLYSFSIYHHPSFVDGAKKFLPVVHLAEFPYTSRLFAFEFLTDPTKNNTYRSSFDLFQVTRQPAPYDTMCSYADPTHCYYSCLSNEYTPLGIKPHDLILTDEKIKLKLVTNYGTNNKSNIRTGKSIAKKCRSRCGNRPCYGEYTASYLVPTRLEYKFAFKVVKTMGPVIQVIYSPATSIYEFVTSVGCLLGIWLSISVIGLFKLFFVTFSASKEIDKWTNEHSTKLRDLYNNLKALTLKYKRFQVAYVWRNNTTHTKKMPRWDWTMSYLVRRSKHCMLLGNIIVTGLFLYHLGWISDLYFSYGTLIQLTREAGEIETSGLKFVLCFHVFDLENAAYPKLATTSDFDWIHAKDYWADYTLGHMFSLQFNKSKVLHSCSIRNFVTNKLEFHFSSDECLQHFEYKTFYMFRFMCHRIQLKSSSSYNYEKIKLALTNPLTIFSITTDIPVYRWHRKIRTIIYKEDWPVISRNFAKETYSTEPNRTFILSYFEYKEELLLPPYDTKCASEYRRPKCMIDQSLKRLGYLPHSEIYPEESSKHYEGNKLLSYKLLSNKKIGNVAQEIEEYCDKVASAVKCINHFTKTYSYLDFPTTTMSTFSVQTPKDLNFNAIAFPRVRLSDFLYDIACCLGFWFGLAVASFNPFAIALVYLRAKSNRKSVSKINKTTNLLREIIKYLHKGSHPISELVTWLLEPQLTIKSMLAIKFPKRKAMLCISLILTCCCGGHLINLTRLYFSYHTVLRTYKIDEKFDVVPSSIFCVKKKWHEINDTTDGKSKQLTVAKIFDVTAKDSEFLSICGGRGLPTDLRCPYKKISPYALDRIYAEDTSGGNCFTYFDVKKFFMNNQVCYRMKYTSKIKPEHNEFGSFRLPGFIYNFGVWSKVTFDSFSFIITKDKPYTSRLFSSETTDPNVRGNWFEVSYIKYSTKCLPLPYDQQNYPDTEFDECISMCLAELADETRQAYPSVVVEDPQSELKVIDPNDDSNIHYSDRVYSRCKAKCKFHRNCDEYFTYYVTFTQMSGKWHGLQFWLRRTDYPETRVEFLAQMRLCDWILEIGNIIGIWFGICMLALNPFNLLKRSHRTALQTDATDEQMVMRLEENRLEYQQMKLSLDRRHTLSLWNSGQ